MDGASLSFGEGSLVERLAAHVRNGVSPSLLGPFLSKGREGTYSLHDYFYVFSF